MQASIAAEDIFPRNLKSYASFLRRRLACRHADQAMRHRFNPVRRARFLILQRHVE